MATIRLHGGTHFLLLRRSHDGKSHFLDGYGKYTEALANWSCGARISPIFALNGARAPDFNGRKRQTVLFCGPLYPGKIITRRPPSLYLSMGLLNVVAISNNASQIEEIKSICKHHKARWEQWNLVGNRLKQIRIEDAKRSPISVPAALSKPLSIKTAAIRAAEFEYLALILTAYTRASEHDPSLAQDFVEFDGMLRASISDDELELNYKHGLLVNTNAALSRQTSQMYSGTSPISEQASDFLPHSLLGIGTASTALTKIRDSIRKALQKAKLLSRIRNFANISPASKHLWLFKPDDALWKTDHLASTPSLSQETDEPTLPHLTYYSGRDGFRSTEITLSVPLELVASCNTTAWTPLTLTHEITHTMIAGVLGALLPRPGKVAQFQRVITSMKDSRNTNFFDQVQAFLCFAIWQMSGTNEEAVNEERLAELILRHWREYNELLTHCFDFLYFYRKVPGNYVRTIWASWDVIPNIRDRVPEYIMRTLCALHTTNLGRKNGYDTSLHQLEQFLAVTKEEFPNALYVPRALQELKVKQTRQKYRAALIDREPLVRFVRHFVYSPEVASIITREPLLIGTTTGDKEGYPLNWFEFSADKVQNPLRFIEWFSREMEPDALKAVWILQHLAFGESN